MPNEDRIPKSERRVKLRRAALPLIGHHELHEKKLEVEGGNQARI
jgi:hypothetical protein